MSEINFEDKMREALKEMTKWGAEYAQFKPLADNLDDLTKSVLSEEMLKHQEESAWKAEAHARTSESYKIHLDGCKAASHRATEAWVRFEVAKAKFEALRSLLSYEKTQMQSFQE